MINLSITAKKISDKIKRPPKTGLNFEDRESARNH